MPTKPSCFAALSFLAVALTIGATPAHADDAARPAFERMLSHAPAAAASPPASQGSDPLLAALVLPLRDGVHPQPAQRVNDAAAASFARMLAHRPHYQPPPVPEGIGSDPLIAALVLPLLRAGHISVAGAGRKSQL